MVSICASDLVNAVNWAGDFKWRAMFRIAFCTLRPYDPLFWSSLVSQITEIHSGSIAELSTDVNPKSFPSRSMLGFLASPWRSRRRRTRGLLLLLPRLYC
jgi:hypothetical protein